MKKYIVIGGQYQPYYYGEADTLAEAKRMADANMEHWDNWQGWHYPSIYRAEDVEPCSNFYGDGYTPVYGADPAATRDYGDGWLDW